MGVSMRMVCEANDQKSGMTIQEFIEFAHNVEDAVKRGRLAHDDLLLGSMGFSAQIKRITVKPKDQDSGIRNLA